MRVNPLLSQGLDRSGARLDVLLEQVADTKPGKFDTAAIHKQPCVRCFTGSSIGEFSQQGCGLWPNWTYSSLAALTMQAHLIGRFCSNVAQAQIEDLLNTSASVKHYREQRIVALT